MSLRDTFKFYHPYREHMPGHFWVIKDTVRILKFRPNSVLFIKWPENRTDTFEVISLIIIIKYWI